MPSTPSKADVAAAAAADEAAAADVKPAGECADKDNKALKDANDSLRNELAAEQASLKQQIAETRKQASGGLSDEDVRRLEHPDEYDDGKE